MSNDVLELQRQIQNLAAENERLRTQLAETRAQRGEYMKLITELMPPMDLPTEEEMAEQMKHQVSADVVLQDIDAIIANGGK